MPLCGLPHAAYQRSALELDSHGGACFILPNTLYISMSLMQMSYPFDKSLELFTKQAFNAYTSLDEVTAS